MVRGIGIDIIEIHRIRKSVESIGNRFLEKVFTASEITYCDAKAHRYQHYAARFAAKEAMSKALSLGWTGEFRWKDVEISNDVSGQPHVTLHGMLRARLAGATVMLSMSHSESHVVAMVMIEDSAP
jgi:holo-[acyl-carrier protein] synthase